MKDLGVRFMHGTIDQFSFRQLHHRYLLLVNDNENLNVLKLTSFPHEEKDNAILLYGYIDSTAGLSFEMLSFAYFSWDGSVQYRAASPDTSMKLRYDSIHGTLISVPYSDAMASFQWKVDSCNTHYRADPAVEAFREIKCIDSSRHPQYPDDLIVFFVKDGMKPEGIWCRICGQRNGHICGVLLNAPYGYFGVTQGDIVEIEPIRVGDEFKAVALI